MAKKQNVSVRNYLDSSGEKSVGPAADGRVVYGLLADDGKTVLREFSLDRNAPPAMLFQLAQFGFVTKVGNVANSVLNGDEPGSRDDAASDIEEFLKGLETGQWREPGEGRAKGPKYDKEVLAACLVQLLGANAKGDVVYYREKLEDRSYYAKARGNTQLMAAYYKAMGDKATPASADALA